MDIKVLQLHKRASYKFKYIQDKYSINTDSGIFALADGTTQSFYSEIWAETITKGFTKNPTFNPNELISTLTRQVSEYKRSKFEFSPNPAKASLEKAKQNKGGTSTLIGLRFTTENRIEVISCGDSNLFLLKSGNKFNTFPFSNIDDLDANNYFINTEQLIEKKIDETYFKKGLIDFDYNDKIIIATDALSRLILKEPSILFEVLNIEDFNQLNDFCLKYWDSKKLQEDDVSAIIIPARNSGKVKTIVPPQDFSFPQEKEEEFIPTSLQNIKRNFTEMEMNEIKHQFNGVAQDFYLVKRKLKFNEMLLIIAISLLILNILLIHFLGQVNPKDAISKSTTKSENVILNQYENTIENLNSEIKYLKNKLAISTKSKEDQKSDKGELGKATSAISKDIAIKRQKELMDKGYNVKMDGIWGAQCEKTWNEYLQKKKNKK
jgi:hypothetical protein